MSMDEDAMFKALLKNKPQQQKIQVPVKRESEAVQKMPVITDATQNIPVVNTYEKQELVVKTDINPTVMQVAESIKNLTVSVNMVHRLLKTVIAPVLVLILIVGVAVLVKL